MRRRRLELIVNPESIVTVTGNWTSLFVFDGAPTYEFSMINWIDSHKQRDKTQWTAVSCERYGKRKNWT